MDKKGQPLVGVILAAGKGSRMMRLPTRLPKPVLPVLDKPIICHQLEIMASLGIAKVFIVVGHRGYEVVREIERQPSPDIEIVYIDQEETLGIAHCVGLLEPLIEGAFLLLLGDIYFHAPKISDLIEEFYEEGVDAVLGAIEEEDDAIISKNFSIMLDDSGQVTRVVEKPRFPKSRLKGVGVYLFNSLVFDAIRRTPRTAMRNEYEITDSIQILIDDGHSVRASCSIEADLNVTAPADLIEVNTWVLDQQGLDYYVSESAKIGEGVVIKRSVIGAGATVGKGAKIKNSVVFADAVIDPDAVVESAVVTESAVFKR